VLIRRSEDLSVAKAIENRLREFFDLSRVVPNPSTE
jgi:hypothetical protein